MLLHCVHNSTDPVDGVEHDEVEGVAVEVTFYQGEGVAGCHGIQHQLRAHLAHVRHLLQEPAHTNQPIPWQQCCCKVTLGLFLCRSIKMGQTV